MNLQHISTEKKLVDVVNGQALTTSLKISKKFNKRHSSILAKIKAIDCSEDFGRHNFMPTTYDDDHNREQPMYLITKDGFMFLVMGFNGREAALLKEAYINEFNRMERLLHNYLSTSWIEARDNGKEARRNETDSIKELVEYAKSQGSKNAHKYFINYTSMVYRALFELSNEETKGIRNKLDKMQLSFLSTAEHVASNTIREGIIQNLHYKDIYKHTKQKIHNLSNSVGRSQIEKPGSLEIASNNLEG